MDWIDPYQDVPLSEPLKVFRELAKLKPPDPSKDYTMFTFEMGDMVGELVKSGTVTLQEAKDVAVELSNMDGTVKSLMQRIWPHELASNPETDD